MRSFGREQYEFDRLYAAATTLMHVETRLALVGRRFIAFASCIPVVAGSATWLFVGLAAAERGLSLGTAIALVTCFSRLYEPYVALMHAHLQVASTLVLFRRVFEILDLEPEHDVNQGKIDGSPVRGEVSFEDVHFGYVAGRDILNGVTFRLPAGAIGAVVGASGAGKTTILRLLPRFFEPWHGTVRIDGRDIREFALRDLRSHLALVPQETFILHDTVANNIRYGRPDASDSDVRTAARIARVHDFAERFPEKYETLLGHAGLMLSGGERQRIAIARALLKDAPILLLDEATSALDAGNEFELTNAMLPSLRGRTCLIVAHRLSTVMKADVIFVVSEGRVVEQGTYDELVTRNGEFARICTPMLLIDDDAAASRGVDERLTDGSGEGSFAET